MTATATAASPSSPGGELRKIAAECVAKSGGDWRAAAKMMRARIEKSATLRDELLRPLIDGAVWEQIRKSARDTRQDFFSGAAAPGKGSADGLRRVAERSWYDYPLANGKPLGDATAEDLREAIDIHRANERTNRQRADWLEVIAERVANGKRVRDCITERAIAALAKGVSDAA